MNTQWLAPREGIVAVSASTVEAELSHVQQLAINAVAQRTESPRRESMENLGRSDMRGLARLEMM